MPRQLMLELLPWGRMAGGWNGAGGSDWIRVTCWADGNRERESRLCLCFLRQREWALP